MRLRGWEKEREIEREGKRERERQRQREGESIKLMRSEGYFNRVYEKKIHIN